MAFNVFKVSLFDVLGKKLYKAKCQTLTSTMDIKQLRYTHLTIFIILFSSFWNSGLVSKPKMSTPESGHQSNGFRQTTATNGGMDNFFGGGEF